MQIDFYQQLYYWSFSRFSYYCISVTFLLFSFIYLLLFFVKKEKEYKVLFNQLYLICNVFLFFTRAVRVQESQPDIHFHANTTCVRLQFSNKQFYILLSNWKIHLCIWFQYGQPHCLFFSLYALLLQWAFDVPTSTNLFCIYEDS